MNTYPDHNNEQRSCQPEDSNIIHTDTTATTLPTDSNAMTLPTVTHVDRFKTGSNVHNEFIKLIEDNNWNKKLPTRDLSLLQFMQKYGLVRKQVLDKFNLYLHSKNLESLKINSTKERKQINHDGKLYKVHNVIYAKDGIRVTKYGYCVVKGCKGAIRAGKMIVTKKNSKFNEHHTFVHVAHPHSCDKKLGLSNRLCNSDNFLYEDDRVLFQLSRMNGIDPANVNEILQFLESCGRHIKWIKLIGGKNDRYFLPNFEKSKSEPVTILRNMIRNWVPFQKTLSYIQHQFPFLVHIKMTILKSSPGAVTQNGDDGILHFDYGPECLDRHSDLQPISVIIALSPFSFIYNDGIVFQDEELSKSTIRTLNVPSGHFILFTNRCHHTGGPNLTNDNAYRIFLYCVSKESDLPPQERIYYLEHSEV
jgi:hypothetical protein